MQSARRYCLLGLRVMLALVAAGLPGCSPGGRSWAAEAKGHDKDGQPLRVVVTRVQPARLERLYRTSGTLVARRAADIVALQPAIVRNILVEEGDHVVIGQVLVQLDGRELSLQADKAALEASNLAQELTRLQSAAAKHAISREELDKQRYAVESAQAQVKLSRHQASLTTVRAPFAGTITRRSVHVGNLATASTVLFGLADLSALDLELHVPEREAATVTIDSPVDIELVDGTRFTAKLLRKAPVVDATTGTVKLTIRAEQYPLAAKPGAFARARVLVDVREQAPSLPRSATFEFEGKSHVYTVVEGLVRRRHVKLGLETDDKVELLGGLAPDELVVVEGNTGINEGMPVQVIDESLAAPGG